MFDFINRTREFQTLQESFLDYVVKKRDCLSYLVQGRHGLGKSRLINEFINSIEADKRIASRIPKFRSRMHVIEYECKKEITEPYQPFVRISTQIQEQQKKYRILRQIGMLAISLLPIHDVIEDFMKLGSAINSGESDEAIRARETKLFTKYLKVLKKRSDSVPLVIYIKNVQWIDDHSLALLHTLIDTEKSMWGMIILEQDEEGTINPNLGAVVNTLIEKNRLHRLTLRSMQKGFEIEMLESCFGPQLFTKTEFEHIYTISEGCPGILASCAEEWIRKEWLYQKDDRWYKVEGFENKIKAPQQKLLDLLITLLQDGVISPREQILINNFAEEWGIGADVVSRMTDLLLKAQELGYMVERRVHSGSIGRDAFLAFDKNRNPYLVEYIEDVDEGIGDVVPVEVKHPHLLSAKEIKKFDNGALIVNDYFEGKTLKERKIEAFDSQMQSALKLAAQVAEGLAELHRNNLVHGNLRPESIIVTEEGDVRLTGLDAGQFRLPGVDDDSEDMSAISYLAPEQISGEPADARSDIFSFGVLLYELVTGELPFQGKNKTELKQAIRFDAIPPFDHLKARIPDEVQNLISTCLHKNPEQRFQNATELVLHIQELLYKGKGMGTGTDEKSDDKLEPDARPAVRRMRFLVPAAAVVFIAAFGWYLCTFHLCKPGGKIIDAIVIGDFDYNQSNENRGRVTPEIVEYLLVDDLMQSSDVAVMDDKEFKFLYPGKNFPRLFVDGSVRFNGVTYFVNLDWTPHDGQFRSKSFDFVDPSALLTSKIPDMAMETLQLYGINERKISTFTTTWDAFESFFQGETAWKRLDLTTAEQMYEQALIIDPQFVLAKLRMASVLQFNGSNARAQHLVKSIQPKLSELSIIDSLRAEALAARLTGKVRKEIDILRNIYDRFPTRKEAPYEVAEAYYAICDIKNAIDFYNRALALDNKFALAHNHLAYCYSHLGKHDEALRHFKRYVTLDSTANAFDSLGDGYMAAGKLDSAAWAKQQGIRLDPQLAYLYGALAYIQIRQGKFNDAIQSVEKYLANSPEKDNQSTGYSRLALIKYCSRNYDAALAYAARGRDIFDSNDLVTRNHELHWLLGLIYLKLDRVAEAEAELARMDELIAANGINATNYRMAIFKFAAHLRACLAARAGDYKTVKEVVDLFDGPIRQKIKDHGSPFDLAFFYTEFGELLARPPLNRPDLAAGQFDKALQYNPAYALAHYHLWKLQIENSEEAKEHLAAFRTQWKNADEEVLRMYEEE